MKKIIFIMFLLIIICLFLFWFCMNSKTPKYPNGSDTVESFGEGTYQIIRSGENNLVLFNVEYSIALDQKLYNYKKINQKLYSYGAAGYTIIDCKTLEIKQYVTLNGYNDTDKDQYNTYTKENIKRYINNYIKIDKYDEFTDAEKNVFTDLR